MFTNPQPRMPPEFLAADACVNFWENRSVIVILSMQATWVTHGGGRGREEGAPGHGTAPTRAAFSRYPQGTSMSYHIDPWATAVFYQVDSHNAIYHEKLVVCVLCTAGRAAAPRSASYAPFMA